MKKYLLLSLFSLSSLFAEPDIGGYWIIPNDKTKKPDSIILIYPYQGKYYGRLMLDYDSQGKVDETIYQPKPAKNKIEGDPPFAGMDIVYDLKENGARYKGKIVDPEKGKVYDAEVWRSGPNLILRGEVFIFGENQTWPPALDSDFPPDFKKPDPSTFIPKIPQIKGHAHSTHKHEKQVN